MPSPFPGMDPYLEGPFWSVFHHNFVDQLARQLSAVIRPKYLALTSERIILTEPDPIEIVSQARIPDVGVFLPNRQSAALRMPTIDAPLIFESLKIEPAEETQGVIEIVTAGNRKLVTAIEVLSPTNKRGTGANQFLQKRRELLESNVHYLEIDLLRIGDRWRVKEPLPSTPYFVFLSRSGLRPRVETWPITLDQPLPVVPVPLMPEDSDVPLDLQLGLQTIYDLFGYEDALDYATHPTVPLDAAQSEWATSLLRRTRNQPTN